MPAFTGAQSKLYLGLESSFGTGAKADLKYKIPIRSESINRRLEAITSEALLGLRIPMSMVPGRDGAEGSFEAELWPNSAGVLFYLTLGKSVLDGGTGATKITPVGTGEDLPSAFVWVSHSGIPLTYKGIKFNQLRLTASVGAIPTVSVDVVGRQEVLGSVNTNETFSGDGSTTTFTLSNTPVVPESETVEVDGSQQTRGTDYTIDYETGVITFTTAPSSGTDNISVTYDYFDSVDETSITYKPTVDPFTFKEISLLYSDDGTTFSSTVKYTNFELTINNNLDADDYRFDGTGLRYTLMPANLEITGSLDIVLDYNAIAKDYQKFTNFADWGIKAVFEKVKDSTTYKLEIVLPRVRFSELNHDINDAGRLTLSGSFTALGPSSDAPIEVYDYVNTTGSY